MVIQFPVMVDISRKRQQNGPVGLKTAKEQNQLGAGFPPGTTVDELHWFSRRRLHDAHNRDNLNLEIGSLKDITSEYTRSFQPPEAVARSLSNLTSTMENEKESRRVRRCSSQLDGFFGDPPSTLPKANRREKRHFVELNGLHLEGDMLFDTENGDKFVQHLLVERPELLKRGTELKLEGDINTHTENRDKFVPFTKWERSLLMKRDTNLHLEGDQLHLPEYKEVYVNFPREKVAMIKPNSTFRLHQDPIEDLYSETFSQFVKHAVDNIKEKCVTRPSNLRCEGDFNFTPEYTSAFKTIKLDKTLPIRHQSTLKLEGDMFTVPEYREKYKTLPNVKMKPIKHSDTLSLNESFNPINVPAYVPSKKPVIPSLVLSPEPPNIDISTDKQPMIRSRPPTTQHLESVGLKPKSRSESKRSSIESFAKYNPPSSPLPSHNENDKKVSSRPPKSNSRRNWSHRSTSIPKNSHEKHIEDEPIEHQPRYVNYLSERQKQVLRRPESFIDDGKYNCQPEYRKAYLDYLVREKLPRNLDDETMNNKDYDLYDMPDSNTETMNKKTKHMSLNEPNNNHLKPSSRRASASSSHTSPKRSSSPYYKLQVTNVDVPKKGFGQHSNHEQDGKSHMRSVSPSWYMKHAKSYDEQTEKKPRQQWQQPSSNSKSFVVLDREVTNFGTKTKLQESPWYKQKY